MSNSARFLDAFNRIEHALRRITGNDKGLSFGAAVNKASRLDTGVRRFKDDLHQFRQLRNAIVHETTNGRAIAEPADWVVVEIERIASLLTDPPRVVPLFAKKVLTLGTEDSIARAVRSMLEHSFSQIPVYDGSSFAGLLTTNTIARWLGAQVINGDPQLDLARIPIAGVLEYTEETDIYCFVKKEATLFEVLEKFRHYERKGKRLEAVLITDNGAPSEKLLGIITVWDLPSIYEIVEEHDT
ncbi:MAG: CBS domain-containing protein [Desulfotomaculales bacterium]